MTKEAALSVVIWFLQFSWMQEGRGNLNCYILFSGMSLFYHGGQRLQWEKGYFRILDVWYAVHCIYPYDNYFKKDRSETGNPSWDEKCVSLSYLAIGTFLLEIHTILFFLAQTKKS